jgi:hypothetical protein
MVRIDINVRKPQAATHRHHSNRLEEKNVKFLSSEMILQYLLGVNEKVETAIMCKSNDIQLVTTDYNVYEALGSTTAYDTIPLNKITKLFEVVDVVSFVEKKRQPKPILKDVRVQAVRNAALAGTQHDKS